MNQQKKKKDKKYITKNLTSKPSENIDEPMKYRKLFVQWLLFPSTFKVLYF